MVESGKYPGSYVLAYQLAVQDLQRKSQGERLRCLEKTGGTWLSPVQARSELGGDAEATAVDAGAARTFLEQGFSEGAGCLAYLGRRCLISFPGGEVWVQSSAGEGFGGGQERARAGRYADAPLWLKILVLHYLNGAGGAALTGDMITFRDLPGGGNYLPNFEKRVTRRLAREFGRDPERFVSAALALGGEIAEFGDAGVKVWALPRVPLVFVLWKEDSEFPAEARVLFDSSVASYLYTEDVIVLCQEVAGEIIRASLRETAPKAG